jgi:phenylacetic acid degradation operon negative regulatory protein
MTQDRKTRPFTARSVVASTLLGTEPPRLPGQVLVRAAELFGIAEGTTRVALSRMVAAGELAADDAHYELTGRLRSRQARQTLGRAAATRRWRGQWATAVVTADRRDAAERNATRRAFLDARYAEVREGVWLRPDNLDAPRPVGNCLWMLATLHDDDLPGRLWDLAGWAAAAAALRREMAAIIDDLEAGSTDALAPGFVLSAAVLRHFNADPLLPAALLPLAWPGPALREDYDSFDAAYRRVLRDWFRTNRPPVR